MILRKDLRTVVATCSYVQSYIKPFAEAKDADLRKIKKKKIEAGLVKWKESDNVSEGSGRKDFKLGGPLAH